MTDTNDKGRKTDNFHIHTSAQSTDTQLQREASEVISLARSSRLSEAEDNWYMITVSKLKFTIRTTIRRHFGDESVESREYKTNEATTNKQKTTRYRAKKQKK